MKPNPSCQTPSVMSTIGSLYGGLSKLARTRGTSFQQATALFAHRTSIKLAQETRVEQDLEHQLAAAAVTSAAASTTSPAADAGRLRLAAPFTSSALPAQPTACGLTTTPAAAPTPFPAGCNHQLAFQPERRGHAKCRQHFTVRCQQHTYAGRRAWIHPQKDQRLPLLAQHLRAHS